MIWAVDISAYVYYHQKLQSLRDSVGGAQPLGCYLKCTYILKLLAVFVRVSWRMKREAGVKKKSLH